MEEPGGVIEEPKPRKRRIVRYVGHGMFLMGVPARDMRRAEFDALPKGIRSRLIRLGIMED